MEKTTMSVREMAERMGISLPMAYDLTRRADFPSIRGGSENPHSRRGVPYVACQGIKFQNVMYD